ncbi:MAG: WYL domain-containing protein [Leptospira sp.]|nr:WYL domain-containing protein [Leptospira sp.]
MTSPSEFEDDFPMIEVKKMNETETRLFALLFNLMKEPKGITFKRFQKIMPRYYNNEDSDSDRKKLYRDLNQLKSMGFNIKVANFGFQSEEHYPYYLEKETLDILLKFTKPELEYLSILLCSVTDLNNETLLSLSQKLFSKSLDLYPKGIKIYKRKIEETVEGESDLSKIIQALKDKRALVVNYGREKKDRTIEPYRLIRKNSEDFYLLAYDRSRNALRRFILPRIVVKKELREDFLSQKKISDQDLNLHPLAFTNGESKQYEIVIHPMFYDSFIHFLEGYPYEVSGHSFQVKTANSEAFFPFFLKSPSALQEGTSDLFVTEYKSYLKSLSEMYTVVS